MQNKMIYRYIKNNFMCIHGAFETYISLLTIQRFI